MWLLQSAYSNRKIGPFENLHRTSTNWSRIRRSLFWGRGRPLRFADGAKSQLLISHCCLPKMARGASRWKNQVGIEVIQSIFVSIPGSKCGTNVSQPSECGHDCLRAPIRSSSTRFRSGGRSRHRVLGTAEHRGQLPGGSVRRVLAGRPTTRE
jgi:hypothetical protein